MLIANLLHNAGGISVVFQPCKMTKGILLFPVDRTKSILFVLYYIYNSTMMAPVTMDLTWSARLLWKCQALLLVLIQVCLAANKSGIPSEDVHLFYCPLRLQERRRSSVVVSLPGLDVSPGDLFVSNGAADILNGSNFSGKILLR